MKNHQHPKHAMTPASRKNHAFTLVELMISLGIALLLIYGINLIFRAVTDTIKTGNALSNATRRMRAIDSALTNDFEGQVFDRQIRGTGGISPPTPPVDLRVTGILPVSDYDSTDPVLVATQSRQPAITIFCKRQTAFLNAADEKADLDGNPGTFDLDENGVETPVAEDFGTNTVLFAILNQRVHRLDTVSFFAGGTFIPKAGRFGSAGTLYQDLSPFPDAWIWYGHALRPTEKGTQPVLTTYADTNPAGIGLTPDGKMFQPGQPDETGGLQYTNDRNKYAADWVLGRMAMCIGWRDPGFTGLGTNPGLLRTNPNSSQVYLFYGENQAATGTPTKGIPTAIGFEAREVRSNGTGGSTLTGTVPAAWPGDPSSFTSLSMAYALFSSSLNDVIGIVPQIAGYGTPLNGFSGYSPSGAFDAPTFTPASAIGLLRRYTDEQAANPNTWYIQSMFQPAVANPSLPTTSWPLRFNAMSSVYHPVGTDGQITAREKASLMAPFLASGCSNFIVEFAGDFLQQNPAGDVTANTPDGVLDFDIVNGVRQTQWYGLPRDVNGDGLAAVSATGNNADGDVLPVFQKAKQPAPPTAPGLAATSFAFEKFYVAGSDYAVAFGPNELYNPAAAVKPSLIRFTVNLVDGGGNLANGMSQEMIFRVR